MQIKNSFDRASLRKIGRGFLVSLSGSLGVFIATLALELNDLLLSGDPINWRLVIALTIAPIASAVANAIKEFVAGVERSLAEDESPEVVSPEVKEIVQDLKDQVVEDVKEDSKRKK